MNEQKKILLDYKLQQQRGAAIIDGVQDAFRQDGYTNMLNKYGAKQDNSTAYQYIQESFADDLELIHLYEGNGLFTKIIDRPAEEAVKHGLDIDFGNKDILEYVDDRLDALEFEDKFATAEKWARLFGGAIIVMLVDDGKGLEEPLDWKNVRSIEELRVFERAIVQPDYISMYHFHCFDTMEAGKAFDEPEYYHVFSIYGYFTVHRSRCLVFRNGRLPEQTTDAIYRNWGIPEYVKLRRALRECITSHENGVKLLERCVQAIYKMKNLANMLSTADGENKVLQRLQVIDMARSILNSIAIDEDGEDYSFQSFAMSGVKDILDASCNMLSAVTDIPQTILFGRSPAGMNSTGKSDMENYYNMVENIQKQNMKSNSRIVVDLILKQGYLEGKISEIPKYKVKFAALWSVTEAEQASINQTKAQTKYTKAQTVQLYMESNVLDPTEVRNSLAKEGDFDIEKVVEENDLGLPDDVFDFGTNSPIHVEANTAVINNTMGNNNERIHYDDSKANEVDCPAAAVLVIHKGKFLCASRRNAEGICGPGGHVEEGETPKEAAIREAIEEFNVVPINLMPVGVYQGNPGQYISSMIYFTDEFSGVPEADGNEMLDAEFLDFHELQKKQLFPPFKESLKMLINLLTDGSADATIMSEMDGGPGSGNFGHGGRPGKTGGSSGSSRQDVDFKAAKEYTKILKGTKTAGGIEIKSVSGHAAYRMKERGYSTDDIKEAITGAGIRYSGNKKNPDSECYQYKGTRIIVSPEGKIVSVVRLEDVT